MVCGCDPVVLSALISVLCLQFISVLFRTLNIYISHSLLYKTRWPNLVLIKVHKLVGVEPTVRVITLWCNISLVTVCPIISRRKKTQKGTILVGSYTPFRAIKNVLAI